MPFGQHKGKSLRDVPSDYLIWLANECNLKPRLRNAVEAELENRAGESGLCECMAPRGLEHLIRTWYRESALRYHPDKGGSVTAMQIVNDCHDRLKRLAGF
jgi:uncharacterized protein (DUF3820 family)